MGNFEKMGEGIYEQDSGIIGPTVTIMGGVHGDEKCGVEALDFLLKKLDISRGKLHLIYGNIEAIAQGKRQIEENLNRMFQSKENYGEKEKQSYEYLRAQEIKPYLKVSEASLDLHSSPTKGSPSFVICEENARELVSKFSFQNVCFGFYDVEPGGTDYFMNSSGKIGICIESGHHNARESFNNTFVSILEFLGHFQMINTENRNLLKKKISIEIDERDKSYFRAKRAYITQTNDFKIIRRFDDFEGIKKGEYIGCDGGKKISAQNNGKILFARDRSRIGVEGFIEVVKEEG